MHKTVLFFSIAMLLVPTLPACAQKKPAPQLPSLADFDAAPGYCNAKGRLQDRKYCVSRSEDQILAMGKDAIPALIAQLTDAKPLHRHLFDYWNHLTTGDMAHLVLMDLFTKADWQTKALPEISIFEPPCDEDAEVCWDHVVQQRGRTWVQQQWQKIWETHKNNIVWDKHENCFVLKPTH